MEKKELAMEMAKEFKRNMDLENEHGRAGNFEQATYYMNRKWRTTQDADWHNVKAEFNAALKEIGVY